MNLSPQQKTRLRRRLKAPHSATYREILTNRWALSDLGNGWRGEYHARRDLILWARVPQGQELLASG